MSRFVAYLGPAVTLDSLLFTPEHGLLEQASAPREQRDGHVNADGFGVGWYDLGARPEPAVYRRTIPLWADRNLPTFADLVETTACLAAVRSVRPPVVAEETGTAPFTAGPWLFAHDGTVEGFRDGVGLSLRRQLTDHRQTGIAGSTDSEVLFAIALDALDRGRTPAEALRTVIEKVLALTTARLNMVLMDGERMAATSHGETLYHLRRKEAVTVASEPFGITIGWEPVADGTLVEADSQTTRISVL